MKVRLNMKNFFVVFLSLTVFLLINSSVACSDENSKDLDVVLLNTLSQIKLLVKNKSTEPEIIDLLERGKNNSSVGVKVIKPIKSIKDMGWAMERQIGKTSFQSPLYF